MAFLSFYFDLGGSGISHLYIPIVLCLLAQILDVMAHSCKFWYLITGKLSFCGK